MSESASTPVLVAVADVLAADHVLPGRRGGIASKTFVFSATSGLGSSEVGGSIATKPSTWKRWVTTMSRKAPVCS